VITKNQGVKKKKAQRQITPKGRAYITAGFNNVIMTITDLSGNTLCWDSGGSSGFKGSRKSTPYAANMVGVGAGKKAYDLGIREVSAIVKGPGNGRASAIKALRSSGIVISSILDATPIPHNGCRPRKRRRN